jgi:hypothetical protein
MDPQPRRRQGRLRHLGRSAPGKAPISHLELGRAAEDYVDPFRPL